MKILESILIKEVIYPILIVLFSILIYLLLKNFTKKIFGVKGLKYPSKEKMLSVGELESEVLL